MKIKILSKTLAITSTGLLMCAACATTPRSAPETSEEPVEIGLDVQPEEAPGPRFGSFGFDVEGMDRTIKPGDDFYAFASGTWQKSTEIPADRARYGVFDMLSLEAEEHVHQLILDAEKSGGVAGSNPQLIGDFYKSWMNEQAIEQAGLDPAKPYLARINALKTHDEAAALMAELHFAAPYYIGILPDPADPTVYTVGAGQSGLGMPTRDYYLDESERFQQYREAYLAYITRLHELAGIENGADKARAILAFETELAKAHWTRERSRQIKETYNVMTIDEFAALAPALHLRKALSIRGLPDTLEKVIVSQPSALTDAGALFARTDLGTVRDYLTFHFLSGRASALPKAFDEASFQFYSQTLSGTEEQRPREKRGTRLVNSSLGHAVGQEYVARYFPPAAKTQMEELVANLIEGFRGRLETLHWMDDETRAQALEKLSTFEPRIGYPEKWDTFEGLVIKANDFFGNQIRLAEHRWQEQLDRFPEPVDRLRWYWAPQVVNASYSPLLNQITFPAGILQAPFFDPAADPAMNYGAIGAVIGHEIGHGFDDQGRRYDAQGRIRDWWTPKTAELFEQASGRLAEQYSQFCPIDDLCVNGRLALGENIGDLGGLQMAYQAYRNYVAETYPDGEAPIIDGFTGDQRFFLAWAQVWRSLYRDDALRSQLVNGPHSPGFYRVNGVVRNLDAWYDAFNVTPDNALYLAPEERVSIW